jgi:cytochrome c biogenesis protein
MTSNPPQKSILSEVGDFFASVKLALVLLIALALTSILGTVLPQGEPPEFYKQGYSQMAGKLIGFFQLYDMYHSWWFQWLLFLLAVNLIVCSLKRFSTTWKVIKASPRAVSDSLFESLPFHQRFSFKENPFDPQTWIQSLLGNHFGTPVSLPASEGKAFYLEKGRFSRFGVYVVHLSVLIIFSGAIIGSLFGFKGFLELKEGQSQDRIFIKGPQEIKKLDFSVKLDRFALSFYPNGMPKEYRSDLSFWEKGQEKDKAVIRVNDPFTYKGITFYQSSWDQSPSSVRLSLKRGGQETELVIPMDQMTPVPETPFALQAVRYVNNLSNLGPALGMILFKDQQEVEHSWILANHPEFHGNRLGEFQLKITELKTRYMSGLQVNQDPGIWFIWIGSSLMLIGFVITFYFSHQQVWIWIREKKDSKGGDRTDVLIGATAQKNRGALVLKMEHLTGKVRK